MLLDPHERGPTLPNTIGKLLQEMISTPYLTKRKKTDHVMIPSALSDYGLYLNTTSLRKTFMAGMLT